MRILLATAGLSGGRGEGREKNEVIAEPEQAHTHTNAQVNLQCASISTNRLAGLSLRRIASLCWVRPGCFGSNGSRDLGLGIRYLIGQFPPLYGLSNSIN